MEGKRFLHKLKLSGLLSFDPEGVEIELGPLNVLIGPNASGKSNLIEAIGLLRAAPTDLATAIRKGGGIGEWLWKGGSEDPVARIEAVAALAGAHPLLCHQLSLVAVGQRVGLVEEWIGEEKNKKGFYSHKKGKDVATISMVDPEKPDGERISGGFFYADLVPAQSILSQVKDPRLYPEMTALGKTLEQIRIYSDWNLGRHAPVRKPQPTDLPGDFLEEDAGNLGLVLNDLQSQPAVKRVLLEKLQQVYEDLEDVTTRIQGGTVQILFHQEGMRTPIPASCASDGTLRFLCLLTILCHPTPPPLVCIEEPELGLHIDMIRVIADLMVEASQRTQLIVTTHSDALIDALTDTPEAVIVCERDKFGTRLYPVRPENVTAFLGDDLLGGLWRSGHLGGNRW